MELVDKHSPHDNEDIQSEKENGHRDTSDEYVHTHTHQNEESKLKHKGWIFLSCPKDKNRKKEILSFPLSVSVSLCIAVDR